MADDLRFHTLTEDTADMLRGADVFDYAVDAAQLSAFIADPGHHLIFATKGDQVVGFASGTVLLHPDKAPAFFVSEVGVNDAFQRQGIATALTAQLLDMARAEGCLGIWLATELDNTAARALYRKLKARETKDIVVYDWDGAMDL